MPLSPLPCRSTPGTLAHRLDDWRMGSVIYQIFVDRFAPSDRLASKKKLYAAPRRLREWEETPRRGKRVEEERNMEGELEFWGGDLASLRGKLDYLRDLGAEVVYLNPIFEAFTNHKYDAMDFMKIDPQYGTNEELVELVRDVHGHGMRVILDGVFNHIGRRSPLFIEAQQNPEGEKRDWFTFREKAPNGYLGWRDVANLPELRIENPDVAEYLWRGRNSVVRHYLREVGIDGWRLDVAPDLGTEYLAEITAAAHDEKHTSVVIGECWNYPEEWLNVLDGVLNLHVGHLIIDYCGGNLSSWKFTRALERMIHDSGIEGLLRCHLVLDNHDTPRLNHRLQDPDALRMARILQFTLPGSPTIYYGAELGMEGGHDPDNRGPMRWDLLEGENETLALHRELIRLRKVLPALRVGDMRLLDAEGLLAFLRIGEDPRQTVLVAANAGTDRIEETVQVRDSLLVDAAPLECALTGERVVMRSGLVDLGLEAGQIRVYRTADRGRGAGYSAFKRLGGPSRENT